MAASIKIEKGVPIPSRASNRDSKYPFSKMGIGDSFVIPYSDKNYISLYQSSRKFAKVNDGFRFTLRKDKEGGLIRIWRIEVGGSKSSKKK